MTAPVTSLTAGGEPGRDCPFCPRLVAFRERQRTMEASWHNAPVASFGPAGARLLIVGLAPGLRGANRTGRPFTGDGAGDVLYPLLLELGLARGTYRADPADGFALVDCRITNAVRCVPPENKPTPAEITLCRPFLAATISSMSNVRAIMALGRIAHDSTLVALGLKRSAKAFAHGAVHDIDGSRMLFDSFHCSRYNMNTGRLTREMLSNVLVAARAFATAR